MGFSPDLSVANQWEDLTVFLNKDADLTLTFTDPTTGLAYNLSGLSVSLTTKPSRFALDAQGATYACTVQNPPTNGIATVTLPAASNSAAGVGWYRVDLIGSETKAVKFGRLTVYAV